YNNMKNKTIKKCKYLFIEEYCFYNVIYFIAYFFIYSCLNFFDVKLEVSKEVLIVSIEIMSAGNAIYHKLDSLLNNDEDS
ncbi:MAG: hypothetical protein HUJ61_00470, partial [Bacilli bacterium]|nr:hypothetical protein [Bacilli bacterium]